MIQSNRWNRFRYRLYAPVYDRLAKPWDRGRRRAVQRLELAPDDRILIIGCGTGSDLPYLPEGASVTAVDITPAMVRRTATRAEDLELDLQTRIADAQVLPFDDAEFDAVLLHLILSVVPDPDAVVRETARVLAPGGRVSIFDKFVQTDTATSLPRRAANPLAKILFAELTRELPPMLSETDLTLGPKEPFLRGLYTVTVARPGVSAQSGPLPASGDPD